MLVVPKVVLLAPPPASQTPRHLQLFSPTPWQPCWDVGESRMHRWVPEALVCLGDQEHIPFPPPLGAWGSSWGSTEVTGRGLGSTGIHQEPAPPYLLKVLVVKGDLGCP